MRRISRIVRKPSSASVFVRASDESSGALASIRPWQAKCTDCQRFFAPSASRKRVSLASAPRSFVVATLSISMRVAGKALRLRPR